MWDDELFRAFVCLFAVALAELGAWADWPPGLRDLMWGPEDDPI